MHFTNPILTIYNYMNPKCMANLSGQGAKVDNRMGWGRVTEYIGTVKLAEIQEESAFTMATNIPEDHGHPIGKIHGFCQNASLL